MRVGRWPGMRALLVLAVWAGAMAVAAAGAAQGAEQFPSSPNHRGMAPFEPYVVFPENRPGNGVYLDNQLIFNTPEQTLVDVLALPAEGRFAYYAIGPQGKGSLGVYVKPNDGKARVDEITPGFYHLVVVMDGVVYKKLYRIIDNNILDLLPSSKTADGAVPGPVGVVFYHVATTVRESEAGQPRRGFGLKLHVALYEDERTRHLDYLITNDLPDLKITWLDESRIQIGLADGRSETLSLSQFQ
jgi:hypothetical protein